MSPKKKSPLKTCNSDPSLISSGKRTASSTWSRPKVAISKLRSRRTLDLSGAKRSLSQDDDSGLDFDRGSESGSSSKKSASGHVNPFTRQNSAPEVDADVLDLYTGSLPLALEIVEASPLVENLKLHEKKSKVFFNPDVFAKTEKVAEKTQKAAVKKAYVPYRDFFDWSLKTRVRFSVENEVSFLKETNYSDQPFSSLSTFTKQAPPPVQFARHMKYWLYPCLNGTRTFPRLSSTNSSSFASVDWKRLMPSLQSNWDAAVLELMNAVEGALCPYFYIATHQWTALILAKELNQADLLKAYVTPTSMGFRKALRENKLKFDMPLKPTSSNGANIPEELNSSGGSDSLEHGTHWIESQCKTVGKIYVEDTYAQDLQYDHRPESLISVTGTEVTKFVKLLVSVKDLLPAGGPLNNVPPTLIAPNSFTNGTLQRLKYQHSRSDNLTHIELSDGPIMPHVIPSLSRLLAREAGVYGGKILFATSEPTAGLVRVTKPAEQEDRVVQLDLQEVDLADLIPQATDLYEQAELGDYELVSANIAKLMLAFTLV